MADISSQYRKGDFLGRYQLVTLIGWGGFGEVWRAKDPRLGNRQVAIKIMRPDGRDQQGVTRFERELELTARMRHPNIVTVFDTGTANGLPFMVMEFLDGSTLEGMQPAGGWDMAEVARIGREVCAALAHAHGQNPPVIHRDIKPSNIFRCRDRRVKVTDFGIATTTTGTRLTKSGYVMGTLKYMAPEVLIGHPAASGSDVWAVGSVLYELLSGKPPSEHWMRHNPVPDLALMPKMPPWLGDAVMRTLRPHPDDRPTASECIQLLTGPRARPPARHPPAQGRRAAPVPQPAPPSTAVPLRRSAAPSRQGAPERTREQRVADLFMAPCPEPTCLAPAGIPCNMGIAVPVFLVNKFPIKFCHWARAQAGIAAGTVDPDELHAQFGNAP